MTAMKCVRFIMTLCFGAIVLLSPEVVLAQGKPQSKCPISGDAIKTSVYFDHEGQRIYACCKKCRKKIQKDPDAALKRIKDNGETASAVPKG